MHRFDRLLSWTAFALVTTAIVLGPWLYGSWEMWWFWPMASIILLSTTCFALRLLFSSPERTVPTDKQQHASLLIASFMVFLVYALIRCLLAEVYMDAERSFLLYFLPFLIGLQIIFGFSDKQKKIFYMLILIDLLCLGVYGLANHFITHNEYVLFRKGYEQYIVDNRATGSYFCPDHFSGIMELAFCIFLAMLVTLNKNWKVKVFALIMMHMALVGVSLSKSRGGGMAIVVVTIAALIWGLSQRRKVARWYYRFISLAFIILGLFLLFATDTPYTKRFKAYFTTRRTENSSLEERTVSLGQKLRRTSRGHMFAGAFKAWKTAPLIGIGPGMHQNLWPYFNNSHDGNKETGTWPTLQYKNAISYEVHNDWLQLLEEYGLIGLLLFCIPASVTFVFLLRSRKKNHAAGMAAVLAFVCMAFHSLGDFNLQMPATTWLLASILALPLSDYLRTPSDTK